MRTLDEYEVGHVEKFGSYYLSREEVLEFASRFDPQPFHLDDAAGAANPIFGRLAASGWHTASATMRMMVDHWAPLDGLGMGSPGMEELRWSNPAYPGDTLRVESEVLAKRLSKSRPSIGLVTSRVTTFNQHDVPVMTMVSLVVVPAA